jgi:hypothetical protein
LPRCGFADEFSLEGLTTGSLKVSEDKLPFLNHKHILQKLDTVQGMDSLVDSTFPLLQDYLTPE